jgi:CubicO group peptidase (beta-lactamase class C family)
MLLVLLALIITPFQSKLNSARELYAKSGLGGIYYRAKDFWPWASPNVNWDSSNPASQGVDSSEINKIWMRLSAADTKAFLILRNNYIVAEKYGSDYGPNKGTSTSAIGKTITAAVLVGLAIDDGLIDLDNNMYDYLPHWRDSGAKSAIKIRHIVTHTSGLDDVAFGSAASLTGWKKYYYENPAERFHLAINVAPVMFEPGSDFSYSGVGFYALAYVLARQFQEHAESDLENVLASRIMSPLGIPKHDWAISYGESYAVDGMVLHAIGSGGSYTPRAIARIGQILLNHGEWNGHQLLGLNTVDKIIGHRSFAQLAIKSDKNHPMPAGIGIWSNCDGYWPSLPRDAVLGLGGSHNFLLIVPSLDLIVVRMGGLLPRAYKEQPHWHVLDSALFADLIRAIGPQETSVSNSKCSAR